jgi:glycosyltransferase involved in cell wall biosynthesis
MPARYNQYLSRLADEFERVVFFADLTKSTSATNVVTDRRIDVVPNPFSSLSLLDKVPEMIRFGAQLRKYLDEIPRVIHVFPAGKVPFGLASIADSGATHLTYFKSDWIQWTLNRDGITAPKAAFWFLNEFAESRLADAMVFRDEEHLKRVRRFASGRVERACPLLAIRGQGEVSTRYQDGAFDDLDRPKLLYVGGLYKPKGLEELAESMGRLARDGRDFTLELVGSATGRTSGLPDWLENALEQHGVIDRVNAYGYVDEPAELATLFANAHALVLPSHTEGFPRVVDEAMSFGLPVVCTAVGGIPAQLTNEEDALLVPPRDVEALTGALTRLLDDGDLRRKLALGAKASFDRRNAETAYEQHIRLLRMFD